MEAAGVELFNRLTARNLLILHMPRRAKKAPLPISLYVYCTKILSHPIAPKAHQEPSIAHFAAVLGEELVFPIPFSGLRNLPYFELPDSGNLNQLVQQEVFISGLPHVLDNRSEPLPLFLPTQTVGSVNFGPPNSENSGTPKTRKR